MNNTKKPRQHKGTKKCKAHRNVTMDKHGVPSHTTVDATVKDF